MSIRVLVIGGGAAGMMAAGAAANSGAQVILLEKNARTGRKLMITGKGRCNITNACSNEEFIANVPRSGRFLYSAINNFSAWDVIDFFENLGVKTKIERGNRVFPISDKAVDVCDAMRRYVDKSGCKVVKGTAKSLIISENELKGVLTQEGREFFADRVIIAAGGMSYPLTGSTGDGYRLARQAGHTITDIAPSLVPLVCADRSCAEMQGLALKNISITVKDNTDNAVVYKDFGEMLFTHFGLSGPVILSASAHMRPMQPKRYTIAVDLKPALSAEQLDARIIRDFTGNLNRDVSNTFASLLPRKMIPVIMKKWKVPEHIKCNGVTKEQRAELVRLLKNLEFVVDGFRPIDEAIVTSGGVNTKEIDPRTMQSRILEGLFFAGEVMDIDAYTGGFNLQIAFSTGKAAGENAAT